MLENILYFVLGTLMSYRLSRIFVDDTIFEPVRERLYVYRNGVVEFSDNRFLAFLGKLLSCHWCIGFYTSIFTVLLFTLVSHSVFVCFSAMFAMSTLVGILSSIVYKLEE